MNLFVEGVKNVIDRVNCCKSNQRTVSHHNLVTEEHEEIKQKPLEQAEVDSSTKEPNDQKEIIPIVNKTPKLKSLWAEDKLAHKLWHACEKNSLKKVKNLLNEHINAFELNAQSPDGSTILHRAVKHHFIKLIDLLLEYTPFININCIDIYKRTPLHIACIESDFDIVKLLIEKGALINTMDNDNNTAVHHAIIAENPQIIEYLILMCPDLEIKNSKGQTAIDLLRLKNITINSNPSEIFTISDYDELEVNVSIPDGVLRPDRPVTLKDFEPVQIIGRGSFGEVFLVKMKFTGSLYAMKVLKKEKIFAQNLVRYVMTERNVLSYINHPFIVRLRYAFQDTDKVFLVLDYCQGGNLTTCINRYQRLPEEIARIYSCEIVLAISELHRRGIIYRDLKPDNVILDADGHALLADFGLSKEGILDNVSTTSFCGSIAYLAPEMIRRQGHGKAVDWYLFGVILYEMLTGKPPYYNSDRKILLQNIESAKLKIPPRLSEEAKDLLKNLLKRDQHKRLGTINDADEIKQHAFFTGINWVDVYNRKLKPPIPPPSLIRNNCMTGYKLGNDDHGNSENKLNGWTFVSE
ncbi:hypothetical protein SteCoe_25014 [Stentor coeruleus]|uniref:non-specific serine/threonine protein kinase n=1 Tax=Stentor coeruleus TaxID=5963 RepID=A0A1R2BG95_9CILI|nr:hypothetical protein SteCoe_25014 [Stentor coeruleus]